MWKKEPFSIMQDVEKTSKPEVEETSAKPEVKKRKLSDIEVLDSRARGIYLVAGALVIGLAFVYLQFSTKSVCCGDFDGYYHIRWSRLLWEGMRSGHFPPSFKWLPLTTLNPRDYVDHHLLFHIFQIPFTWFGDLTLGAKISAALFASIAVLSCFMLILRFGIRYPFFWLLALLACSAPFLYRLNMAKAPPFAIIFMVLGIYLLFVKRYWALLPVTFLFALTYDLFLLLPIATVIWVVINLWAGEKLEWRPLMWVAIGSLAGFALNPYFPRNVMLYVEHAAMKLNPAGFKTAVGQEWYPYDSWYLLTSCIVAFAAMTAGYIAFDGSDRKKAMRPLFFLIFSTLLMVINFNWRRFVEYWPPFAVLFAAFSLQAAFDAAKSVVGKFPDEIKEFLNPYLDREDRPASVKDHRRQLWLQAEIPLIGAGLSVLLFYIFLNVPGIRVIDEHSHVAHFKKQLLVTCAIALAIYLGSMVGYYLWRKSTAAAGAFGVSLLSLILLVNVYQEHKEIANNAQPDQYKGGMEWVKANVPAGQVVFNTDWDDFPKMFFYDTNHAYVSGLDPTYLLDSSAELSKLYEDITLGREKNPGPLIREKYGANYVFTDNEEIHDAFYNNAIESGWFEKVYDDDDCTVLKIRETKGEPPADDGEIPPPEEGESDEPAEPVDEGAP